MPYDHSRNAGNKGDVWKHAVLVSLAYGIDAPPRFTYVETHSGAPQHKIGGNRAWRRGIGDILDSESSHPYVDQARQFVSQSTYPAGWKFFADALAPRCDDLQLVLCDVSEEVASEYSYMPPDFTTENVHGVFKRRDGFEYAKKARAELIFLDPPYSPNAESDWTKLANTCNNLKERGVPHIAWYPVYWPTRPNNLVRATGEVGIEVLWADMGSKPSQNMKGCGMLVSKDVESVLDVNDTYLKGLAMLLGSKVGPELRQGD